MAPTVQFLFDFGSPNANLAEQVVPQFEQQKSVQLQVSQVRIDGTNGLTAKATGMVKASFAGVDASGVPPRGRPV